MSAVQRMSLPGIGVGREIASGTPARRATGATSQTGSTGSTGYSVPFDRLLGRSVVSRQAGATTTSGGTRAAGTAPAGAAAYRSLVESTARRYGLDPALLLGVVDSESGFNPRAVSAAGAKGLMQLMDGTARGLGVTDSFSPEQSLDGGARYLRDMLGRYGGSVSLALAAYNAGPGAVDRHGGIPPYQETQTYVSRVLTASKRYGGLSGSST
jgi:soluble lytic murein transglycosylase-like protein